MIVTLSSDTLAALSRTRVFAELKNFEGYTAACVDVFLCLDRDIKSEPRGIYV